MDKLSLFEILFSKDEDAQETGTAVKKQFFSREFSGSVTKQLKRLLSLRVFRFARAASYLLSHISTRVYGTAFLTFGMISALMYFLKLSADATIATPIIGLVLSLLSIPFLLADKPLPIVLQDFVITDYIFFDLFCMKRHTVMEEDKNFPILGAVVIGLVPAVLSAFLPLWQIALAIGVVVFVYVSMESPEFIFLASLFALPYLRLIPHFDIILACAVIIGVLSFLRKVLYGKRAIYIEQYDIVIGVMLLFVLISGVFVKGIESFSGSVRMIVFALGYILAGNIITNRRLADRTVISVIMSGVTASIVSVTQLIVLLINNKGIVDTAKLDILLARADGMTVFFITAVIFSFGLIGQSQMPAKAGYVSSAVICLLGLLLTGEVFALWAVILSFLAYLVIKSNKLVFVILPVLLICAVLPLLLPGGVLDVMFYYSPSVISAEEMFSLWQGSLEVFAHNLFVGIGIGSESFVEEMAGVGIFSYPDSSNLFIELGLEAGVFALLCLLLLLITRLRHRAVQYMYVRNSQIEIISGISGACLFALMAFGMVNYIWSDISAYYLFWCLFGIGSAALRVAKRDYDDQVVYYEETSAHDASVIDIEIG